MQPFNMGDYFCRTRPAAEIEAQQLIRPFGRCPAHPQTDKQAGNQRHVDLQLHTILTVTEEMPTPQDTFKPPEKKFDRPPIPIREGNEVSL